MWSIVFLAMGGIALGKGVMSSGLLDVMDSRIKDLVSGLSLGSVILILSPIVLVSTLCFFLSPHMSILTIISPWLYLGRSLFVSPLN